MIVFCAGMYRSCSTWQYAVIAQIIERHRGGERLGYLSGDQFGRWESSGERPGWWVLKSHEGHRTFEQRIKQGKALAVYAFRDTRDVVYSLKHKRSTDFATLLRLGMVHQVLVNDRFWRSHQGVLVQRYERIVADPLGSVKEIAGHLGVKLSEAEAREIANQNSLEANRERTRALGSQLRQAGLDLSNPANAQHFDPHTLLHWNHVREGRVGSWRDEASPEELAVMGRMLGGWLIDRGYERDLSWVASTPRSLRKSWEWQRLRTLGAIACGMRCASSRYPELAGVARRWLGLPEPESMGARAVAEDAAALPVGTRPHVPQEAGKRRSA